MMLRTFAAAVLLTVLAATVTTNASAAPRPTCRAPVTPVYHDLYLEAKAPFEVADLKLRPGDIYRVVASGSMWGGWTFGGENDPNGYIDWAARIGWPLPGANEYMLIGRYHTQGWRVPLGTDSGCIRYDLARNDETLDLLSNDWALHDNRGGFNITVVHYPVARR